MPTEKRNSILCPNCNKLISKDEEVCPYCGMKNPNFWAKNDFLAKAFVQENSAVTLILLLNILMYGISIFLDTGYLAKTFSQGILSWLSPNPQLLSNMGMTGTIPLHFGYWWSLLNANYLHGGILHIGFNMYALTVLAPLTIQEYGTSRFFIIYTVGGIGGFVVSFIAGVPFTLGASGAICALMGAILYYAHSRGGMYGKELRNQVLGWLISLVIFGAFVGGINNWAHGGGFAFGLLFAYLLKYKEILPERFIDRLMAMILVVLTFISLAWGVFNLFIRHAV